MERCTGLESVKIEGKRVRPSRPGLLLSHSTSLGAAAAGLDSNSEDDRCLSDFTLQWQSSKISHHIVKAFKTLSIEAGGNIEVWERDDGYVEPLPAYPTTYYRPGWLQKDHLGKLSSHDLANSSPSPPYANHWIMLPKTLPFQALPTISNPQNGSTSAPTVEDLSTSLHSALSALHKLEDVPREEVQIEPMIGTQERFDDSYYTPEMRTYELRRIV
ncbi:hypothetical protein DL96DRAFT_1733656 [Flagelloscypha sp. PMI_526]|nr:hypothetical protein DL96DRAFT_1733656 [Flagelloscypha sp. PMI_526]